MSESTQVLDPVERTAPVRSGWRRAFVVFALLGAAAYGLGLWASRDSPDSVPMVAVILPMMLGPLLALVGFGAWWVLLGDGRWWKRVLAAFGVFLAVLGVVFASESAMQKFALMWGIPLTAGITGLALVVVPAVRRWPLAGLIALAAVSPWLALRVDGVDGAYVMQTSPRWKKSVVDSASDQLADRATVVPPAATGTAVIPVSASDWPGFRGANRDSRVPEVSYRGWDGSAPKERWRNDPVGPAWSSFCVVGDFIYTQEQRGNSESVVCYRADTGKEVWARGQTGKHSDSESGPGPRATPTYSNGRIFAASANGSISCLRASDGEPVWPAVDLAERFGAIKPYYGYAPSPLVLGDLVIVNPAAANAPRLVALDAATGSNRWASEQNGAMGYSSPQLATIAGVQQVLIFNGAGVFGHDTKTGRELWHYEWPVAFMEPTAVQPLVLPDGRVIVGGANAKLGSRCVTVRRDGDKWTATETWKSNKFTPQFNDFVCVGEHLYGLDDGRLVCFSLANKSQVWREGDYGRGQVLLVGDKLLVVTEKKGQLACVVAKPDEFDELWKVNVVKGKMWNHPAIARGRLYIRNATEMVAFDLPGWTDKP